MDIIVKITPEFLRIYNKLEISLQEEIREKIDFFKVRSNHKTLKVHKLHGRLNDRYSFSVNYKFRIIFKYLDKKIVALLSVGDHEIYK
jgi:plasmid maintenance system killer protein